MYVPRNVMLLIGLLTCAIGPALVLVVLGCVAGALVCMVIITILNPKLNPKPSLFSLDVLPALPPMHGHTFSPVSPHFCVHLTSPCMCCLCPPMYGVHFPLCFPHLIFFFPFSFFFALCFLTIFCFSPISLSSCMYSGGPSVHGVDSFPFPSFFSFSSILDALGTHSVHDVHFFLFSLSTL